MMVTLRSFTVSGQEEFSIRMKSDSKPIIKAEINGKKGYFLVDTGASISIINSSQLKFYHLEDTKHYGSKRGAIGFNGQISNVMKVKNPNVIIGDRLTYQHFYSLNLDKVTKSIEAETGYRIAGILGTDVLKEFKCVIDYHDRLVTMVVDQ